MMKIPRKFKVIDLFAGAGGFSLGFQLTKKYEVICSLESDAWAIKTLKKNRSENQKIIHDDIRKYKTVKSIKQQCRSIPHVIIGGPPCQGFSIASPANKKDPNDPRNTLFKDFARWVKVLNPHVFVMENVTGLLSRKNEQGEKVFDIIVSSFKSLGYSVDLWKLNAAEYGVPQLRERVFIVGNRHHLEIQPPKKTHYIPNLANNKNIDRNLYPAISVGEAILDLPEIYAGEGTEIQQYEGAPRNQYQKWIRNGSSLVFNHVAMKHTHRLIERFKHIQNGKNIKELPEELSIRQRNGNGELSKVEFNSNYRHLQKDRISYTIPASFYSSFIHPSYPRNITAREAARLQSFPDWYKFEGKRTVISSKLLQRQGRDDHNYLSQYNQIGNAVPPLLAKKIADHLHKYLLYIFQKN